MSFDSTDEEVLQGTKFNPIFVEEEDGLDEKAKNMMKKWGYIEGLGLGKNLQGPTVPLKMKVRMFS
jgi:hypothetical protein